MTPQEAAKKELAEESFRKAVEAVKKRMMRPWYKRFFPYRIEIKLIKN